MTSKKSGRKHPFRAVAVEKYQRAQEMGTPELTMRWRYWRVAVAIACLVGAVILWG